MECSHGGVVAVGSLWAKVVMLSLESYFDKNVSWTAALMSRLFFMLRLCSLCPGAVPAAGCGSPPRQAVLLRAALPPGRARAELAVVLSAALGMRVRSDQLLDPRSVLPLDLCRKPFCPLSAVEEVSPEAPVADFSRPMLHSSLVADSLWSKLHHRCLYQPWVREINSCSSISATIMWHLSNHSLSEWTFR